MYLLDEMFKGIQRGILIQKLKLEADEKLTNKFKNLPKSTKHSQAIRKGKFP